ncbi:MAG: FitA-like ribbon-helix-helix domain-containing protein [Nitriliruptorales bacterium]
MLSMYIEGMSHVQIRDVPAETHAVLKRRAAQSGMSLQEYLLSVLTEHASRPTVAEVLARAGGRAGGRLSLAEATRIVRQDRDQR